MPCTGARFLRLLLGIVLAVGLAACGGGNNSVGHATGGTASASSNASAVAGKVIGGSRPVQVHVPPSYRGGVPIPLVVLLHAYRTSGDFVDYYFQLQPLADSVGFLYVHPDGSKDSAGDEFWNATDACCDTDHSGVNDSGYLEGVIRDIEAQYSVDPKRIYVVGHSNGGFMAYRMACDHADTVAAIVSVAGAMFKDANACKASRPVSVLEVHGTSDDAIPYGGGQFLGSPVPGARASVSDWARFDGCVQPSASGNRLDIIADDPSQSTPLNGKETRVSIYRKGCRAGTEVQLWTVVGGNHIPEFSREFAPDLIKFLFAHPKP